MLCLEMVICVNCHLIVHLSLCNCC